MTINYEENIDKACGVVFVEEIDRYVNEDEIETYCGECEKPILKSETRATVLLHDGTRFCSVMCLLDYDEKKNEL
jgi:hypothetical protein